MQKGILIQIILVSTLFFKTLSQDKNEIDHVVYLFGNTSTKEIDHLYFQSFKDHLLNEKLHFSVIHLGDILPLEKIESESLLIDQM